MSKNLRLLVLTLLTVTISSIAFAGQYSPAFPDYLADHRSETTVTAIITMADQVDLRALQDQLYAQHADRRAWHEAVVRALQAKATETQADLLATLADLAQSGQVEKYHSLWIGNIVIVTATPAVFDQLVTRNDILQISPDYQIEEVEPVSRGGDTPSITGHEVGADRLHVPEVWAMGYTGQGRLVSHLDTGVDGTHPALASRWRGVADSRYADHPEWAWCDPLTNTQFPQDWGQHGTHTMGTICGRSGTTYDTVGVAIDAQWISAGVIDRQSIPRTVQDALTAFEWVADPDLNPATVWDVPDVNSNSWGVTTGHGYPPCDETFWTVLDGCEAAGIVVVFAAGNEGPGSNTLRRPADRATTDLTSFSVGAVDGNNVNLPIADFSSRGPSYCTPDGQETFKPEVVAPGVNVRSSIPGGGYQSGWSGTSMATPHIAGIVALMRQANPNLTSEQVRQILLDTADDLGQQGEDNTYGKGVANAYAAVQRALAYLSGWGTLGGIITDQASGNPIQGAMISVVGRPWSAASRANGQYYLFMPADTAWNIRVEFPPNHLPVTDQVTVTENDTLIRNYALEGKVPVILTASFGNPANASYRSFYLKGSWNADGFYDASWSAPATEVKDNGQAPDQTANDGIFTGQILLARDMTHTYSWAIYTENYGGENSRLQNGANFQITSLTPPTVPTLSVNPCGSEHNWIITAYGDNGLNLDLARVDDNHPNVWAAADSLFNGTTYTFLFRTMHCNVVTYGVGGVGGTAITYTPTADGAYDFIFDDRDDSYIIRLAGTEGPPTYPSARSGLDHHVTLSWLPPGTVESQEMSYDDGTLANAWYFYDFTNLIANEFIPSGPVTIDSIMVHNLTAGDPYWPWPDGTTDPIGLYIFLDDGSGYPQTDPVWYGEATGVEGEWVRVDVPEIAADGNFWIAWTNIDGGGDEGIGLDLTTDYPGNKWERFSGVWQVQARYEGDQMIRAKVFGNVRDDGWMSYDDGTPAGMVPSNVPRAVNSPGVAAGTGSANMNGIPSLMAYHPKISVSDPPVILNTEVLAGYNIYRDVATGPFNRPTQTKVNASLITATSYDDWGGIHGPNPLTNGIMYYYQLSAVYDIGGGQFVEVGPSVEVTATPVNHAPVIPFDVSGSVNGRTIHVNWSWANRDSDVVTFTVYKKQLPGGTNVVVGTTADSSYDVVIPAGEDGIYRVTITAKDDGAPPLESEPSRGYDAPIGHLPPSALAAISNYEFAIPLRWMRPGSYRLDSPQPNPNTPVITKADPPHPLDLSHKGEIEPLNPPMLLGRGGPDAFGYEWIDSDEPDGPSYSWREITDIGTQMPMANDDQNLGPFDIGFDVEFYGQTFNQFYVCSNGWVSFTSTDIYYNNQTLPNNSFTPFNLIAPFWDDLYPPYGGEYWYYSDGNELVISFINVMHIGSGGPYTFQVILRSSGSMVFQYQTLDIGTSNSCTIGIQNADGSDGLQVAFNQDYLHDEMAIRIGTGPDGFAPVHYKLYRGNVSGFPTDPAHLLNGSLAGDLTSYIDLNGIQNGTTYYYKISAVWEDSVESPTSNEASAAAANHDPLAPFNLTGAVDGRDVTLHWSFFDSLGDFDHFNMYKKLIPGGTWTMAGSTTDSSGTVNIPDGQDGTYTFAVTAVDDGTPPLESGYSNSVFLSIGHLPPINLRGTTDQESCVPLAWNEPGLRPTTTLSYDDGILANGYYYFDDANLMAQQFTATAPVELDTIWVHVLTDGDQYWPWPDGTHDPVSISVYSDDGFGYPGDQVFYQETTGEPGEWIMVPIEGGLEIPTANFWIALGNLAGGGEEGMGLDAVSDYPQYKWNYFSGAWIQQDLYAGDHMVRATIIDNGRRILLSEKAPTEELALKAGPVAFGKAAAVAPLLSTHGASIAGGNGDLPRPLDTETMVGYAVYRSTSPNVPIDAAHRIRTYQAQGLGRTYVDSACTNGTSYYYVVTAMYDEDSVMYESPPSNEVMATPRVGGRMVLNPLSFNVTGQPGQTSSVPLNIANPGGLNLNFGIVAQSGRRLVDNHGSNFFIDAMHSHRQPVDKSNEQPEEPVNPPMLLDHGGPDEFGYQWIDSDDPGGPAFSWAEITDRGVSLYMSDDDNQGPFDLGFNFSFYGNLYSSINICSNGWLSFTSTNVDYTNGAIPDPFSPLDLVAPFWDDMYPPGGGEVWYYSTGDSFIVSYINMPHFSVGGPYTYQAVLTSNGAISFNYMDLYDPLNSNTIGIQNSDGSIGLQIAYDQDYIHPMMSIRIYAGWLSSDPASGIVAPGGNSNVNIIFDATFLDVGDYTGSLVVTGTDANHQVGQANIPVTFHVRTNAVDDQVVDLPKEFGLAQNYPNPFNPTTEIKFTLPTAAHVNLDIYNIMGQKVNSLVNSDMEAGYRSVVWNGTDASGNSVASGMYFYVLKAGDKVFTRKMTMLK